MGAGIIPGSDGVLRAFEEKGWAVYFIRGNNHPSNTRAVEEAVCRGPVDSFCFMDSQSSGYYVCFPKCNNPDAVRNKRAIDAKVRMFKKQGRFPLEIVYDDNRRVPLSRFVFSEKCAIFFPSDVRFSNKGFRYDGLDSTIRRCFWPDLTEIR